MCPFSISSDWFEKKMNSNGFIRPFFAIRTLKSIPLAKTLDQNLPNENRVVKVHLLFCFRPLRSLGSFAKETFILIWHNFLLLVSHYFQHFFLNKRTSPINRRNSLIVRLVWLWEISQNILAPLNLKVK